MIKYTLTNDFHHTSTYILIPTYPTQPLILTRAQARRIKRKLCHWDECTCSGPLGIRGPSFDSEHDLHWEYAGEDGSISIRLYDIGSAPNPEGR